jgi:ubiquinone biosynthesis protein
MSAVTRVYSGVRGIQSAIKDAGRMREIVIILARHGFGAALQRIGATEAVGIEGTPDASPESRGMPLARRLRTAVEELGPTFIKLGQILSTRADLLPADIIAELQHLQDNVPELKWDDVREVIERETGGAVDVHFAEFREKPLACASIAQVHRAVLRDGQREVVVKVQRPNIAGRIDSDLSILAFFARQAASAIPDLELMDPVGIVAEFDRALRKELDFTNELSNIKRFQGNFAGYEGVHIPEVFESISTSRVLVMEFINGVKITQAGTAYGHDMTAMAPKMLQALLKMIFKDGYFHGDLHPGNILVRPDGEIGLIDYGLVGRLSRTQRDYILDIFIALSRRDYAAVSRVFFDIGVKVPGVQYRYEEFEADVIELMESHLDSKSLAEIDIGTFFRDIVSGAIKHKIRMPPTYTMVFKALMTVEGIGKSIAPDLDFIEHAQPFVREVLLERYAPDKLLAQGAETLNQLSKFLRQFPVSATQLLRDAQRGDLVLRTRVERFDELVEAQHRTGSLIARAVVLAGCWVSAALTLHEEGARFLGLPIFAALSLVVGLVVGWPLLALTFRK